VIETIDEVNEMFKIIHRQQEIITRIAKTLHDHDLELALSISKLESRITLLEERTNKGGDIWEL
jgi:hypothetical protein